MSANLQELFIITVVSNPVRYQSRYILYRKWAQMVKCAGARLVTVEMAFGDRPHEVTERDNPYHIQLRSIDELWHKENMLNLAINYICQQFPEAKYFAWVDADVFPMRPPVNWFEETWHALQHYHVVQMFEAAIDCDPHHNPTGNIHKGFISEYIKRGYKPPEYAGTWYYGAGHPGYAWAATREAINWLGGLIEVAILGAGDRHMALGLVGCMDQSIPKGMSKDYRSELLAWQARATRYIKRDVGFVPGGIYHYWHGKKRDRGYHDRWKILIENNYQPSKDIVRDSQGLFWLETNDERQIRLRDEIRSYFRSRNEDSIDVT